MSRLPISCCYIVKNEDEYLRYSLSSVADWVSELIITDSGSIDKTKDIAHEFESRVPRFVWQAYEWTNDFSAARNFAAKSATQPWILFVDGDEVLDSSASERIEKAIREPNEVPAFSFIQRNYTRASGLEDSKTIRELPFEIPQISPPLFYIENWMERLYRNKSGIHYEGVVHESLIPSCERLGLKLLKLPVVLHHFGRLKSSAHAKLSYYLKLSEQKWRADINQPVAWIELAINLMELQQFERAYSLAEKAVAKFKNHSEIMRMAFQAALRFEQYGVAELWIHEFLKLKPRDLYALSQLTTALLYQGKLDQVLSTANEIFREDPSNFVAHLNSGVVLFERKEFDDASRHLQIAGRERPQDTFVQEAIKKVTAELQNR